MKNDNVSVIVDMFLVLTTRKIDYQLHSGQVCDWLTFMLLQQL